MCAITNPIFYGQGETFPQNPQRIKIVKGMQQILAAKKANVQKVLDNKWQRYNPILIGGDLFTMGYMAFQGVQALKPSVQGIAAVGIATLICGIIGGAINIGVGLISFVEAVQALKNGDKLLGSRLLLDCLTFIPLGVIMIVTSLAIKLSILGGIATIFSTNPWLMPLLFFINLIPLFYELSYRIATFPSIQKPLGELEQLLQADIPDWNAINDLYSLNDPALENCENPPELLELLSNKMEKLQADMGVTAAISVFELLMQIRKREQKAAQKQLAIAKERMKEWNRSLYVRMFQQILYIAGFCVSMSALSPKVDANLLNGTQNFFLAGANAIPLYMDSFWPFKRNTTLVVPKAEKIMIKV